VPANTPQEVHQLFAKAFSAGDIDAVLSLYEQDATLMPQPGHTVSGHEAMREALNGFLAINGQFTMQPGKVIHAGDIALLYSRWKLVGTDPDGNAVELSGQTTDVVRRQADGSWLMVIDNPYGADGVTD
jgi:uncharacterized protein (TIGR02246 family)